MVGVVFLVLGFLGCAGKNDSLAKPSLETMCCLQCAKASSKDPEGRDISMKSCTAYVGQAVNGESLVSEDCVVWFKTNYRAVSDCR
jgi:hypothetical protein